MGGSRKKPSWDQRCPWAWLEDSGLPGHGCFWKLGPEGAGTMEGWGLHPGWGTSLAPQDS